MDYLISCDWFQYCCSNVYNTVPEIGAIYRGKLRDERGNEYLYKVDDPEEFHVIYRTSFTIKLKGVSVLHVHYNPCNKSIPQHYVAVKVANRVLYSSKWGAILHDCISVMGLKPKNITRIDLCIDFQKFANGITPQQFMKKYFSDEQGCYLRKGSNYYTIIGKKRLEYSTPDGAVKETEFVMEEKKSVKGKKVGIPSGSKTRNSRSLWETIYWGTRSSPVMVRMYNKSKELTVKKRKDYIVSQWQEVGLIEDAKNPVYRIELQITSKALNYQHFSDIKTGEKVNVDLLEKICYNDMQTQAKLEALFWSYCKEYFCFYEFQGQKYVKDMKVVQLFERECLEQAYLKPRCINRSHDTGRSEMNASSTFEKLTSTLVDAPELEVKALDAVGRVMGRIGALKKARYIAETKKKQQEAKLEAVNNFHNELQQVLAQQLVDEQGRPILSEYEKQFLYVMKSQAKKDLEEYLKVHPDSARAEHTFRLIERIAELLNLDCVEETSG